MITAVAAKARRVEGNSQPGGAGPSKIQGVFKAKKNFHFGDQAKNGGAHNDEYPRCKNDEPTALALCSRDPKHTPLLDPNIDH